MTEKHAIDRPEDAGNDWDLERAVRRPGVKQSSVVVSVRLRRNDFDKISECAKVEGVPTSTFMRNAALEKIEGKWGAQAGWFVTGGAILFMSNAPIGYTTSTEIRHLHYEVATAPQG